MKNIIHLFKVRLHDAKVIEAVRAFEGGYSRATYVYKALTKYWWKSTSMFHFWWGEMSPSLFDLYQLCGLPISGDFYDEFVLRNLFIYDYEENLMMYSNKELCEKKILYDLFYDLFNEYYIVSIYDLFNEYYFVSIIESLPS